MGVPTFFEIGTALGFAHFARRQVEVAVLEVGLGGRFDSTNVCAPLISVITNISIDHTAQLGDRIALIAREKAGIIKPGVPVVTTAEAPEALAVIEQIALERQASLTALGRDFHLEYRPGSIADNRLPGVKVSTARAAGPWLPLRLFGQHQAANAAGVVAVVEQLETLGLPVGTAALAQGLANVNWPARLEVVGSQPLIVLDCRQRRVDAGTGRHARRLIRGPRPQAPDFGRFQRQAGGGDARCRRTALRSAHLTHGTRERPALPPESAAEMLRAACSGAALTLHQEAAEALQAARAAAGPDDLIAISGSVFLAGQLRPNLVKP